MKKLSANKKKEAGSGGSEVRNGVREGMRAGSEGRWAETEYSDRAARETSARAGRAEGGEGGVCGGEGDGGGVNGVVAMRRMWGGGRQGARRHEGCSGLAAREKLEGGNVGASSGSEEMKAGDMMVRKGGCGWVDWGAVGMRATRMEGGVGFGARAIGGC